MQTKNNGRQKSWRKNRVGKRNLVPEVQRQEVELSHKAKAHHGQSVV